MASPPRSRPGVKGLEAVIASYSNGPASPMRAWSAGAERKEEDAPAASQVAQDMVDDAAAPGPWGAFTVRGSDEWLVHAHESSRTGLSGRTSPVHGRTSPGHSQPDPLAHHRHLQITSSRRQFGGGVDMTQPERRAPGGFVHAMERDAAAHHRPPPPATHNAAVRWAPEPGAEPPSPSDLSVSAQRLGSASVGVQGTASPSASLLGDAGRRMHTLLALPGHEGGGLGTSQQQQPQPQQRFAQGNSPPRAIADTVVPASPLWKGVPQPSGGANKRATVSGGSDQSSDGSGSRTFTPGVHAATHVRRGRRRPPPDPASGAAGLSDVAVSETGPADIFAEPASVAERRANRAALDTLITERLRVELRRGGGGGSGSDSEGSDGGGRALLTSANGTTSDANAFVAGPLSAGGTYTRRAPRAIPVARLPALARVALSAGSSGVGGLSSDAPAVALGSIGSGAARLAKPGVYPLVVGIDPPLSLPASMQRRRPSSDGPLPSPSSGGGGKQVNAAAASSYSSSPMVHLVQSSAQVRR